MAYDKLSGMIVTAYAICMRYDTGFSLCELWPTLQLGRGKTVLPPLSKAEQLQVTFDLVLLGGLLGSLSHKTSHNSQLRRRGQLT